MLKKLFQQGVGIPTNRQAAVAYAEEMAGGIRGWMKIDAVGVPLVIFLWAFNIVPTPFLLIAILFAIGCPVFMVLGYSIGWSRYLSWSECYKIVKTMLSN